MDRTRTTRRLIRRACPYSKTLWHRAKASEGEHTDTSQEDIRVRLTKRNTRDDTRDDGEGPSSSVDIHRESPIPSADDVSKRGLKQNFTDDGRRPNGKKRRPDLDLTEAQDEPKLDTVHNLPVHVQRALLNAKYQEQEKLGQGGCGSVFAGYRKADHLPVAIKHVPRGTQFIQHVDENGNTYSVEVAVMLKLTADTSGSAASSAPVSLLDWYDLEQELILVLERPVPCMDLATYIKSKGGSLDEREAKIILKQLIDAVIELQDKRIFHRDIKVENILIETGSDFPRVRLIDFGLSCFVKRGSTYQNFYGTPNHVPPELFISQRYRAGPTTAWQMGVVLYETVHMNTIFQTIGYLQNGLRLSKRLSRDCRDFLKMCLTEDPKQRVTLEQLKDHPWLGLTNTERTLPRHTVLKRRQRTNSALSLIGRT